MLGNWRVCLQKLCEYKSIIIMVQLFSVLTSFKGKSNCFSFLTQIINTKTNKKSTEEKENYLVKIKIQQLINSSFLFSFQSLTSVFVANQRSVESYSSMPCVSKTRQRI